MDQTAFVRADSSSNLTRNLKIAAAVIVPTSMIGVIAFALFTTQVPRAVPGTPIPNFSLPLLSGGRVTTDELKGAPVVINFWSSLCPPCIEEAPELERAFRNYEPLGVQFLGINNQDLYEDARAFVRRFGLTFQIARDVDEDVAGSFGVTGLPETYFIDAAGKFASLNKGPEIGRRGDTVIRGPISESELRRRLEALLEKDR